MALTENMHHVLSTVANGITDAAEFDGRTVRSLRNRGLLAKSNKLKVTKAGGQALIEHEAEAH